MPRNKLEKDVFPGEKLAVIEEFNEGPGTYQEEGEIRSTEIGISKLDTDRRALYIEKKTRKLILAEKGMEIIAEVGSVARRDARIDIFMLNLPAVSACNGRIIKGLKEIFKPETIRRHTMTR